MNTVINMDTMKMFHVSPENRKRCEKWLDKHYPGGSGATLDYENSIVVEDTYYQELKRVIK